jgi:hypothetical protein
MVNQTIDAEKINAARNIAAKVQSLIGCDHQLKLYVVAEFLGNGFITTKHIEEAGTILIEIKKAEMLQQAKINKERQEINRVQSMPDVMFPKRWNAKNADPGSLDQYLAKANRAELESFLKELKGRPFHWRSLFKGGQIVEATQYLEKFLDKTQQPAVGQQQPYVR